MEPHLHLTVAWRALDRKWGKPVDLDTLEESTTCIPALVDNHTTTFSSEDYLNSIKTIRNSPYSRADGKRRSKSYIKRCDSFSNISIARVASISDFDASNKTLDSGLEEISPFGSHSSGEVLFVNNVDLRDQTKKCASNFIKQLKVPTLWSVKKKLRRICSREKM